MKHNTIQLSNSKRYLVRISQTALLLLSLMFASPASAQITIGGNVYGGGNKGAMSSTADNAANVTIKGGQIAGKVFGGARQAGIAGGTHVLLDGANASTDIIIGEVYGGNDVSGTVGGTAQVKTSVQGENTNRIYVTNLYGGGNGDYDYDSHKNDQNEETNEFAGLIPPSIANTVIDIKSGCYGQVFAGGNSATVTKSASITLNNATTNLKKLVRQSDGTVTETDLQYQFDRVFGGNNQVAMAIRPTWTLTKASIDNLYSGGNAGDMTHPNGILLAITGEDMVINNVYGGCRKANVNPARRTIPSETLEGVAFRAGYAARTLITGGKINNVYGGNDITGNVYGGCALEIRSSIQQDVYGGGNGSYAYANKASFQTSDPDLYYTGTLYNHRPNAESVYLHVMGTESKPTYIGGSLYCGGNSATLTGSSSNSAQLEIGSFVIADKVFLGSNGENMVTPAMLQAMNERNYFTNEGGLTNSENFEEYLRGVEVGIKPSVNFDADYVGYSSKFGSLYCGGNVGSMSAEGQYTISFLNSLVIYDKIVGGCNNANVPVKKDASDNALNAYHMGGLTKAMTTDEPKVLLNISGVKLEPRKLSLGEQGSTQFSLEWNKDETDPTILKGANVYGGCYESGYVNGNVQINVTADAISDNVFNTTIVNPSGASYEAMRDNPLVSTMSIYGGGYGKESEIWGDVAVNITNNAHILKVYGGGELGIVGKMNRVNGVQQATAETAYNTTVTLEATVPESTTGFAAVNAAKIYGGGFQGLVTGNTRVNLDKGSTYNAFAGACNANIWGATEIYVGKNSVPTVYNNIYGGNDFGGLIKGSLQHSALYSPARYQTVRSNTYIEYYDAKITGNIFGGPCGSYDYSAYTGKYTEPVLSTTVDKGTSAYGANSFVNIVGNNYSNKVASIFGGGEGKAGFMGNADMNNSYVLLHSSISSATLLADNVYGAGFCSTTKNSLVDAYRGLFGTVFGGCYGMSVAAQTLSEGKTTVTYMGDNSEVNLFSGMTNKQMDIYGAGAYSGSKESKVTLNGGYANNVYASSLNQGITYLAMIEVPETSTAHVNAIFGGGKGQNVKFPCDTYTSFINYNSGAASVEEAIYGGNHDYRITRFPFININAEVKNAEGELKDVYGAGYGANTVAQFTKVKLNANSKVRNVFGGGRDGKVYDMTTVAKFMTTNDFFESMTGYVTNDIEVAGYTTWFGEGRTVNGEPLYSLTNRPDIRNTQVLIAENARVTANAYGGGEGADAIVSGTTGVDLNGGIVAVDVYGGGLGGHVKADLGVTTPASTDVNIIGGSALHVYGGGLNGNVIGNTNTVLGIKNQVTPTFVNGLPTVERSIYGGGQLGTVEGRANLTIYNGYIGYKYNVGEYIENLDYKTAGDKLLSEDGNAFGGGYGEGALVDSTLVTLYAGTIRNGLYGGGEIAAVGQSSKAGAARIYMYGGHVIGDVFGGGRGFSYDVTGTQVFGSSLHTDGYIYGCTDVNIRGGEVGTAENVEDGHGNVFGGGNIGYVYSVNGKKLGERGDNNKEGYYYNSLGKLTEDSRVIISPYAKVTAEGVNTIAGIPYKKNSYVPTDTLNLLRDKNTDVSKWEKIDLTGVKIHNAVFAGGNISSGSDQIYANTTTVFGNASAVLNDVYFRDMISIGTEHTGGLYGDGNLTFVDGYRELNVTNYGTDYYGMSENISLTEYESLTDREREYFELKYRCVQENNNYATGSSITEEEYHKLDSQYQNENYWVKEGFCSIYAGRLLNTIQRVDFVGIFGSRMVLQGAMDRVPSVVDYTNYTLNRVGEVSLNKMTFKGTGAAESDKTHGNYFGMYNVVNYLGALTSDVDFDDVRTSDNGSYQPETTDETGATYTSGQSYLDWKKAHYTENKRNMGSCPNKVALSSGVYLEILKEPGVNQTSSEKNYGYITGVVELDLINVMTGLGGGYVYAKNEHRTRTKSESYEYPCLSAYNKGVISQKKYSYSGNTLPYETSGNFIHDLKQIVDECYPDKNDMTSAAHYWFVKGQVYVYDQYFSAFTGSSQALDFTEKLPLTLTAGANGKITLLDIKPQYYAYWYDTDTKLGTNSEYETVEVNKVTYKLNDIITYWDYLQLSNADKVHFVPQTYVITQDYKTSADATETIKAGSQVYLPTDEIISTLSTTQVYNPASTTDDQMVYLSEIIRPSNDLTHEKGYALSVALDNPEDWDAYYTNSTADKKISSAQYNALTPDQQKAYVDGPTYKATTGGVLGQHNYIKGDIINGSIYDSYKKLTDNNVELPEGQATVYRAYVATAEAEYTIGEETFNIQPGVAISYVDYQQTGGEISKFGPAMICTTTLQYGDDYIFQGELITETRLDEIAQTLSAATGSEGAEGYKLQETILAELKKDYFEKAYICTSPGKYGGESFTEGNNYTALSSWAYLSSTDRKNFTFNYDALDVLLHSDYPSTGVAGGVRSYDKPNDATDGTDSNKLYSLDEPVDYTAKFVGWKEDNSETHTTYTYENVEYNTTDKLLTLNRSQYEALKNEQKNFAPIIVDNKYIVNTAFGTYKVNQEITAEQYAGLPPADKAKVTPPATEYYVVKVAFSRGEVPYTVGQTITQTVYNSLEQNQKDKIDVINRESTFGATTGTFYYCRNAFNTTITNLTLLNSTSPVTSLVLGNIINSINYKLLPNEQKGFAVSGKSPNETSRLFVSSESDIRDLTKDRVITLIYQYEYDESDASMTHIEKINERHVLNIHITFKSGVPTVGNIQEPNIVLPGTTIGLKEPVVKAGAYEILGGGWEVFPTKNEAERHANGAPFNKNSSPVYWYQDGYYATYYAKTYLGKTYSKPVQLHVANYHDIADVMADTHNSMYIGHSGAKRAPKIYISDDTVDETQEDNTTIKKSELDLFKDLYDRTLTTTVVKVQSKNQDGKDLYYQVDEQGNKTETQGTTRTDFPVLEDKTVYAYENVLGGKGLDFILTDNVHPEKYTTWTPIGKGEHKDPNGDTVANPCFNGTLHGDGYTISGLSSSLYAKLCGNVYNLGVTGSFTGSGIADEGGGHVENCWVSTTSPVTNTTRPIFASSDGGSLVNSYYVEGHYTATNTGAKAMPMKAFRNGEVAYNLNGFYLQKRKNSSAIVEYLEGKTVDGTLTKEGRFTNDDFIYANGTIPEETDVRWDATAKKYLPKYPDDYIFFGQMLTYGYVDGTDFAYQNMPSHINKTEKNLLYTTDRSNRVFRAPAYFKSNVMDKVHFNYQAVFADKSSDNTMEVHPNMTAVDFTAYGDKAAASGWSGDCFYPPYLDYDGLKSFQANGLTHNLLVYADNVNDAASYEVLDEYLFEPDINQGTYNTIAVANTDNMRGHLVDKSGTNYVATHNHLLVDKQDFNAPIEYKFADGYFMWYQRTPDVFADGTKGWETICLPFTADLVTTQQKGEITHFYGANKDNAVGHEYWLRGLSEVTTAGDPVVTTAQFVRPMDGTETNVVDNSFLWDYYYSKNDGDDKNRDDYQKYWNEERSYAKYPYYTEKVPYIIAFPGENFYEFDMSGSFAPANTYLDIEKLDKQTVTFVSGDNQEIFVSDGENRTTTANDYNFRGFYQADDFAANEYYALDAEGAKFDKGSAAGKSVPFRAYFRTTASKAKTETIFIGEDATYVDSPETNLIDGSIQAYGQKRVLHIVSHLDKDVVLPVYTAQGQLVKMVDLRSGAHEQISVSDGIYIVHGKKVVVTK